MLKLQNVFVPVVNLAYCYTVPFVFVCCVSVIISPGTSDWFGMNWDNCDALNTWNKIWLKLSIAVDQCVRYNLTLLIWISVQKTRLYRFLFKFWLLFRITNPWRHIIPYPEFIHLFPIASMFFFIYLWFRYSAVEYLILLPVMQLDRRDLGPWPAHTTEEHRGSSWVIIFDHCSGNVYFCLHCWRNLYCILSSSLLAVIHQINFLSHRRGKSWVSLNEVQVSTSQGTIFS